MMTAAPQHLEIFVTHVAEEGPLLKIWGQIDRSAATFVERLILQYTEQFDRGIGVVYPQSLTVDQLCCAKYGEDGVYYRARIADLSTLPKGYVRVNFIDYGNSDLIDITNIRSLQVNSSSPLCSIQNQATEFVLAGVVPPMGVSWDQATVEFVRQKLCYAEFRCAIVAQLSGRKLITLYYQDTDFSEILIQKNLAIRITLHAQQNMFQNMQYQLSSTPSYNFSVPPPPVLTSYSSNANLLPKTPTVIKPEPGVISAPILSVGSKHTIYISYVEDGPYLFAVQLKATENILQNMTQTFSHVPLKPFSQSPIPGSACVSLLPQAKVLCRAVVTNITEKDCVVYCVDFGNTETVPFTQIFELPSQFLPTKSLALRFCLAGIQNTSFDENAKRLFQDLVTGESLTLEVVEPEGPPLKQFGNIYLNGENILNILKNKLKELEKSKAYPQLPILQPGRIVNVTVSYVESVENFYVQYDANAIALEKIMKTMLQYCTNSAALIRPNELYIGMPVCALFSVDQQWYRARVVSVTGDQISVFYVDYGNTDTVGLMSLRQMDPNLSQAQVQAVACCLSGFEGASVPLEDLSNKLEELTLERKLTMKIVNRLSNGKFVVELHDTTVAPVVNIGLQLLAPPKKTYEETPIDEWRDPASSESSNPLPSSSQFGKERSRQENGDGEGRRTDAKRSGGWNDSRDSSKKWGNRDDKSRYENKWNRDDQSGEQKRWGREEKEGNSGWDDREERGGNKRWESDSRSNNNRSWDRGGFNKDNADGKERDNKRAFNRDDEDWKDNTRRFNKGSDDWKEKDSGRRGFNKDGDDWKSRDNNRRFNKDGEDRNWRKRDEQGQENKKWWGHDDRGEPEKKWGSGNDRQDNERKWGSKDDGEEPRKWGGRDNKRTSNTGDFKKWNSGDRGNRRNFGNEDSFKGAAAASTEDDWGSSNAVASTEQDDWDGGGAEKKVNERSDSNKIYSDAPISFGTKENAVLVFADNPSSFVIQLNNKADDLAKMMENIASVYQSGGSAISEEDQKVLSPCIALYSEDNAWYRAIITNTPSGGLTEVRFVDYGNQDSVSSNDVKEVVPEFLSIPLFGIPCSLFAVQVPVTEWSTDQITEFLNLADGKELEVYFIKKEGPLFEVVLFDAEEPNLSINEKFGASKPSIEEGMSMKKIKTTPQLSNALKLSSPEVVYASADDCFLLSEITPEMTDTVSVTWFISPDQFYCQRHSTKAEFASMVNDIQKAYKGRAVFKGDLAVGFPVIAQFPADKVLYRAEIKEIKGLKYQVQYVDYGNMELLAACNIWQIEKRFLELPKQAIECCVSGIKPSASEWPKDSPEFDRLFGVENLECVFHNTENGKNLVSLTSSGKDVAEELVTCGLAVRKVEERVISEERLAFKLLKGQQIPVHVSFIESLSKFYVHLDPVVAKDIQERVDKHVLENKSAAPILPADMVEHQMVLATPDGNQWYRGKIIDTSGTVGVCVSFVDFGDSDDIPVEKIRPIPEELMGLRHQATECFVIGSDVCEVNREVEESFKLEVEAQDVLINIEDIVNERLSVHVFDIEGGRLALLENIDKSAPLDVEPLCPMPILTHTVRMWVSHVEKLDEIWFQRERDADTLSGLLELLFNFYEEEAKGLELGDPEPGQLCAAKSINDGSWYRAKVKEVMDAEISAIYTDYGNSETLPKDNVKELDPSFYRVHALATCASLAATVLDLEKTLTEFQKITSEIVFDVSFVKDSEAKWFAHLENDDINVIHHLSKSNLASEMPSLFQSEQVSLPTNEKIDVSISHFESCSEFWVQMDSNFLDVLELQQILTTIGPNQAALTDTVVGTLCIAQFSDEVWYRAKILEINCTSAKVHFLDYGNTYETDVISLKKLPVKFFRRPYFAVKCCLADTLFLETVELTKTCSAILSDTDSVFQLQVIEGNDPVHVSLFVGENELQKVVIERNEMKSSEVNISASVDVDSPADVPEITTEIVYVSHVSSPAKFWIQRDSASLELQALADALVQAVDFEPVSDAKVGSICAALFEDDEQWYRAKILEICEEGYKVIFVDYGNSSIVTDIRVLPAELLNKPIVAQCCKLRMPVGIECWSTEADQKFVELSQEGSETFDLTVLSSDELCEVNLFHNGTNVSDMLSELCVSCEEPPSGRESTGTITHINHAGEFWIHWETNASKLELITDKLVEAENFDLVQEYSDGLLCVAQFPDDELWYRSRILSYQEQNIEVFFIDYGNTASVSEVRSISQDLACIPPLAKRCALPLPNGLEDWPEKAKEEFLNIFGDGSNVFRITIVQEGDPSIINLELNGCKVVEMLEKCCAETLAEKLNSSGETSCKTSSTEVEILSETEFTIDPTGSLNTEEQIICEKEPVLNSESEISNVTCEIAKEILNEMIENSVLVDAESELGNEEGKSVIGAQCEEEKSDDKVEKIVTEESETPCEEEKLNDEIEKTIIEESETSCEERKPNDEMESTVIEESETLCEDSNPNDEIESTVIEESETSCEDSKPNDEIESTVIEESETPCEESKPNDEIESTVIEESETSCEERKPNDEMESTVIEESETPCEESKPNDEIESTVIEESETPCEEETSNDEMENTIFDEFKTQYEEEDEILTVNVDNESSVIAVSVLDELTAEGKSDSVMSCEELKEQISLKNEEVSESPSAGADKLIQRSATLSTEDLDSHEKVASSSEIKKSSFDQLSEDDSSPKKSEIIHPGKHGVEHCEQIIKDFSVHVQMPAVGGKSFSSDGVQGSSDSSWNSSPARKLSHAERIVPGSISRGHSIDLGNSLEGKELESQKPLEDNATNVFEVPVQNILDDRIMKFAAGDGAYLEPNKVILQQQINYDLISESDVVSDTQPLERTSKGLDECIENAPSDNLASSLIISSDKDEAVGTDDDATNSRSTDSKVLSDNESSSSSSSPQKGGCHDAAWPTTHPLNTSDHSTHPLDTSNSTSTSVVSCSSPQNNSKSTELESEIIADVSGNLYEDSDSSTHSILISDSVPGGSKNIGIDEEKMKYYEFAQMHTNEEIFESSKNVLKSTTSDIETKSEKPALTKPEKLLVEEKEN